MIHLKPNGLVDTEGEGEGGQGGREARGPSAGSNSGGAEGRDQRLVEEKPFCLGGKVHRRTSWVEQALHREGLLRRAQKAWAYGTSDHLPFCLRKSVRF